MKIKLIKANYHNAQHQQEIPFLLNAYACDPMGGGEPIPANVLKNLVPRLAELPHAFSFLAYVDGKPAGLANCFEAFSTFAAKPLVNIHDICVLKQYRGLGLSQRLLEEVEAYAGEKGCCKVTLEVLSSNDVAKQAYKKFGFDGYSLAPDSGVAEFWQKKL